MSGPSGLFEAGDNPIPDYGWNGIYLSLDCAARIVDHVGAIVQIAISRGETEFALEAVALLSGITDSIRAMEYQEKHVVLKGTATRKIWNIFRTVIQNGESGAWDQVGELALRLREALQVLDGGSWPEHEANHH